MSTHIARKQRARVRDVLSLADCYLHDPFYLVANYTRADLLFSARGFVPASGRTIARMDMLKLAKAISTQAIIVSQWASGSRSQFHRAHVRAALQSAKE